MTTSSSSLLDIKDQEWVTLRFAVGDRVLCLCGTWLAGTVVKHFLVQKKFPPGKCAPYQVELDNGRLIFASADSDKIIVEEPCVTHIAATIASKADTGRCNEIVPAASGTFVPP